MDIFSQVLRFQLDEMQQRQNIKVKCSAASTQTIGSPTRFTDCCSCLQIKSNAESLDSVPLMSDTNAAQITDKNDVSTTNTTKITNETSPKIADQNGTSPKIADKKEMNTKITDKNEMSRRESSMHKAFAQLAAYNKVTDQSVPSPSQPNGTHYSVVGTHFPNLLEREERESVLPNDLSEKITSSKFDTKTFLDNRGYSELINTSSSIENRTSSSNDNNVNKNSTSDSRNSNNPRKVIMPNIKYQVLVYEGEENDATEPDNIHESTATLTSANDSYDDKIILCSSGNNRFSQNLGSRYNKTATNSTITGSTAGKNKPIGIRNGSYPRERLDNLIMNHYTSKTKIEDHSSTEQLSDLQPASDKLYNSDKSMNLSSLTNRKGVGALSTNSTNYSTKAKNYRRNSSVPATTQLKSYPENICPTSSSLVSKVVHSKIQNNPSREIDTSLSKSNSINCKLSRSDSKSESSQPSKITVDEVVLEHLESPSASIKSTAVTDSSYSRPHSRSTPSRRDSFSSSSVSSR